VNWPTMSDYQEAVQNPANCFSDAQLKAGTPTLNALGLPSPVTGGFCSVYQVTSGKTRWAVRCFLHNIRDGRERYKEISKYLRGRKLKETVGFEYVQDGIRVRGDWHPVLKMEWVDGLQLNTWVDRHSQDPKALRQLEERWAALMDALEAQKIGHCDLQHGNVLVDTHDQLKLIDYDGMYVPALRGKGSHEKGHPAYQHPQRDGRDFDDTIDRFAALVISTSLIAVAESPALWKRFYDDDNLIFKRHDFMDPDGAPVFQELKKLKGVVADRAGVLRDACKKRLTETPRLRDVRGGSSRGAEKKQAKIFQIPFAAKKPAEAQAAAPMKKVAGGGAVPAGPPALPAARPQAPVARASAAPAVAATTPATHAPPAPRPAIIQLPKRPAPAPAPKPPASLKAKPAKQAPAAAKFQAVPPPKPQASGAKPSGSQPAWITGSQPATSSNSAPATRAPAPSAPTTSAPASAKAVTSAPAMPQKTVTPKASRPAARRVTSAAATWTGSGVEWVRPGELRERHIWQVPVVGQRQVPRTFLGLPFGTRTEKYAESHEEKVEDVGYKLGGHRLEVTSLAFTLDARLLVSASRDGSVRVWNVKRGREACAPLMADSAVLAMALVPDHTMIAAVLEDRAVVLWDHGPKRRVVHVEAPDHTAFKAVAVSADGQWVAAGGAGRRLHLWNTERGIAGTEFQRATGRIEAIAFTPDGAGIVCTTHKNRVELFDRGTGEPRWSTRTTCGRIAALYSSRHSRGVIGGARDGTVVRWSPLDGSEAQRMRPTPERMVSLASTPDVSNLLIGLRSGKASVFETSTSREVGLLDGHPGAVTATALSATGKLAATGSTDGSVRLWGLR
jgi:WD40 repeat protein